MFGGLLDGVFVVVIIFFSFKEVSLILKWYILKTLTVRKRCNRLSYSDVSSRTLETDCMCLPFSRSSGVGIWSVSLLLSLRSGVGANLI
jgi:hypothetical protein